MMREFSSEFSAHLASGETTLCACWKVERTDGNVSGFTDHDQPLEFDNVQYLPASGFSGSEVTEKLGAQVDASDVLGVLSSSALNEDDIALGRWDHARITTFRVNWRDPSLRENIRTDVVGEITREDGIFRAELRALKIDLNKTSGRHYSPFCDAELGDARCGIDLAAPTFATNFTVHKIESDHSVSLVEAHALTQGWLDFGLASWISGQRDGLNDRIIEHLLVEGRHHIRFATPVAAWLEVGDDLLAKAGCNKLLATCRDKFSNVENFRGFPHIPGVDAIMRAPSQSDNLDGGAIVS